MTACLERSIVACAVALAACVSATGGATRVEPSRLDARWLRAAPTPVVMQRGETDCGLAALSMIAGAWGRTWSVDDLARRMPPHKGGIRLGALRDLARTQGLDAYAIRANTVDLRRELAAGRPVVLGLVLPVDRRNRRSHYEVAVALDPSDGTVVTIDPGTGAWQQRSARLIDAEWRDGGYAALVVTGELQHAMPAPSTAAR